MFSLTYVSSATHPFTAEALRELLIQSRANNERRGLTGMLLYKDGSFMQVLEGERDAVLETQARIEADPRHKGILVLLEEEREERDFSEWSMAFRDLSDPDVTSLPGYDAFLNTSLRDERFTKNPAASQRLLAIFKRNLSR